MSIWLDYSFARPDLAAAKAAGAVGVIRYLAPPDPGNAKILTPTERDQILAAGLDLALVYESYAARALEGRQAGAQDALIALAGARGLDYPPGACLYFAVDTDVTSIYPVLDYFRAVRLEVGDAYKVGVYGEYDVVEAVMAARLADYGWQTVAWSAGQRSTSAVVYQNGQQWFGNAADENEVTGPVGSWLHPTSEDSELTPEEHTALMKMAGLGNVNAGRLDNAAYAIVTQVAPAVAAIRAWTQTAPAALASAIAGKLPSSFTADQVAQVHDAAVQAMREVFAAAAGGAS